MSNPPGIFAVWCTCIAGPDLPLPGGEIQRDLKDGPKASIDRLLSGKVASDSAATFARAKPKTWVTCS